MKKIIDQVDFDNVEQISRRWKKDSQKSTVTVQKPNDSMSSDLAEILNSTEKQNMLQDSNTVSKPVEKEVSVSNDISHSGVGTRKRQVMPQVIDEDTEHFRNRLEHLLNGFKTDAVSEFMSMKRDMVEYQKSTIKEDTKKYLTMYEEKHQELLQTKEKLLEVSKEAEKKTVQCELMSEHIARLNQKIRVTKHLSRPFALLYQNKEREKMIRFKFTEAARANDRRLQNKSFNGWRNLFRESRKVKEAEGVELRVSQEVEDIVSRFQKEMQMLKEQLWEANRKNEEYENNKHMLQDNLKKAFLRGMSAMNLEAMGVLGDQSNANVSETHNDSQLMNMTHAGLLNQTENMSTTPNRNLLSHSMVNQGAVNHERLGALNGDGPMMNSSSIVMGKVRTESKEHRWREAPMMGLEQQNEECEEPRPILIKPSTEGKVIKVIDGKSSAVDGKKKPISANSSHLHDSNTKSHLVSSRKKL